MLSPRRAEPAIIRKISAAFRPEGDPVVSLSSDGPVYDAGGFAVLADGMGGHAGGALASRTVCENFLSVAADHSGTSIDRLIAALKAANTAVAAKISENPLLAGMGSTLIGAAFGPERHRMGQRRRQSAVSLSPRRGRGFE